MQSAIVYYSCWPEIFIWYFCSGLGVLEIVPWLVLGSRAGIRNYYWGKPTGDETTKDMIYDQGGVVKIVLPSLMWKVQPFPQWCYEPLMLFNVVQGLVP